jgi:hypothetical protein
VTKVNRPIRDVWVESGGVAKTLRRSTIRKNVKGELLTDHQYRGWQVQQQIA